MTKINLKAREEESKEEFRVNLTEHEQALLAEMFTEYEGNYEAIALRFETR